MSEPNIFKQPSRADKAVQASIIAHVRHTAPESDEAAEGEEAPETRFGTTGALRHTVLVDENIEYCVDVADEASERVWHIAVWPAPADTKFEVSHCFVVGSKGEAREILRSLTGAPAYVPNKSQQAVGPRAAGYVGRGTQKPGRTQQKQG